MSHFEVRGLSLDVPGRRLFSSLDLRLNPGDCLAVMGPSGSGKTSLLNCFSGITAPTTGSVTINGTNISTLDVAARAVFRLRHIGLVFQFGELLPELSVIENVGLPLRLLGHGHADADRQARAWLTRLGLEDHHSAHPTTLSGGELQRAGIARAMVHSPVLILADEPTGALDEDNATTVARLLLEAAKESGATVIMATHDPLVAEAADRVLHVRDRRLVPGEAQPSAVPVSLLPPAAPSQSPAEPRHGLCP